MVLGTPGEHSCRYLNQMPSLQIPASRVYPAFRTDQIKLGHIAAELSSFRKGPSLPKYPCRLAARCSLAFEYVSAVVLDNLGCTLADRSDRCCVQGSGQRGQAAPSLPSSSKRRRLRLSGQFPALSSVAWLDKLDFKLLTQRLKPSTLCRLHASKAVSFTQTLCIGTKKPSHVQHVCPSLQDGS